MNGKPTRCFPPAWSSQVQVFVLPDLFPTQMRLLLDMQNHTALCVQLEQANLTALSSFSLTPSATRVFEALLRAYPFTCSYRDLFAALFPLPGEQEANRHWEQTLAIRPIRRALAPLRPILCALGIQVLSLRGRGYMLVATGTEK